MSAETMESAAADADAAPLDLLLTDAALGVLNRVNPGGSGLRLAAALAARPRLVASRTRNLLGELTRIAAGTSQIEPSRRDRRFTDPGWAGNPLLRRVLQGYLAAAQTAEGLAQDADLDWADRERAGFVLTNVIDALAPSNNPVLNPNTDPGAPSLNFDPLPDDSGSSRARGWKGCFAWRTGLRSAGCTGRRRCLSR